MKLSTTEHPDLRARGFYLEYGTHFDANKFFDRYFCAWLDVEDLDRIEEAMNDLEPGEWLEVSP